MSFLGNSSFDPQKAARLTPGISSACSMYIVIVASLFFGGCAAATRVQQRAAVVDLTDRFLPANPVAVEAHFERHLRVTRKGQRKDALVLVAPLSVAASLQGVSGPMMLEGSATPVFNVGDGIQMDLFLRRTGTRQAIGSRYFDPGRKAEDRDWIPIAVPLDLDGKDQLEIEITGGPQGDLVADWLALSSVRLRQRKKEL